MNQAKLVLIMPLFTGACLLAQTGPAQRPPLPPPPMNVEAGQMGAVLMPGGPGMVNMVFHEFAMVGKPVTGAPYSAVETTESIQTLSDGNRIVNSTIAHTYRDSQGRIRHEVTLPALGGNAAPPTMVTISDPVAGVSYSLDPVQRTAVKMPAAPKLMDEQFAKGRMVTMRAMPALSLNISQENDKASRSHEDLGMQEIQGVKAQGTRETTSIAAGAIGNERPITITSERWYSPDLKIELKTVRNDPRMGETSVTVTDLSREEPDPSLFQVPSDYTVQAGNMPFKTVLDLHKPH
jgi:hypothetical protein